MRIHTYTSSEVGLYVNAYLVETANGVVAIDATLTVSDSLALRAQIDTLHKPLLAVLVTHAHPDHVAGLTNIVNSPGVPILATESVERLMRATEAAKHAQWSPVFGAEWITHWTYPNRLVAEATTVSFDGVTYRVHDMGAGGDCDANALWVIEGESPAAFVGDLVFNGTHCYLADGKILRWLTNLKRMRLLLDDRMMLYPGHGQAGGLDLIDQQHDYLMAYCTAVAELAGGAPALDEAATQELIMQIERYRPNAALSFMIGLSASAVTAEMSADHRLEATR
jgi:glyoxylase-like metal-dependent hydrolase (beta-lactamase superfamily II)